MVIRFGDRYEVTRLDRFNWGVCLVLPEGAAPKEGCRRSDDGRALQSLHTYHPTCASAVRKAAELLFIDGVSDPACRDMAELLESVRAEVSRVADEIGSAAEREG